MALESGTYIITSKENGNSIGRPFPEDHSPLPKKVAVLPGGIEAPRWVVEKIEGGNFILKIGGNYTADIGHLLFAVLNDIPGPTVWKIEPQFHLGRDTYTIVSASNPSIGWFAPINGGPGPQIVVGPLIVQPSYPPRFPDFELFEITRID